MYDFNAVQKRYLATCLRMRSMPEVYKIDIKRMHVDAMTEKGGVIFSKECKSLLGLHDGIGTKGDKTHIKREAKSRLNHKYYWVNKEDVILFNGIKDIYNSLNSRYTVIMKTIYHIR